MANKIVNIFGNLNLEQAYIIFSVVYVPFTVLLLNQGFIPETLIALYTIGLLIVTAILIGRFILLFGKHANEHSGEYGTLFVMYVLDVLIPLLMVKVYAMVIMSLLPERHVGLVCEVTHFIRRLFWTFDIHQALNIVILGTLVTFAGLAALSVKKDK